MNAPATAGHLAEPRVELIPLTAIAPSDTHIQKLRRQRYNMESLADLRMSIAKSGVLQNLIVRPLPRGLTKFELVAGERRYRAAGQAGLAHVPCSVVDMTDEEVLEIQLVENLQREDLHPLEEAAGYEELLQVSGMKKEDLGARIGKSRSWVFSRMNLLKLPADAQAAMQDGRLDVSRALIVAACASPNQQAKALQYALELSHNNQPAYSVRQLRAKIHEDRLQMPLVGAPFDRHDEKLLPEIGGCAGCDFRTGNCDPGALDPDVCTNPPCFAAKVKAAGEQRRIAIVQAGGKVLKGEDARKLSPSVKTVYGHVDLDHVCGHDNFPEERPVIKGVVQFSDAYDSHPDVLAWHAREEAWRPRTYRALFEGEKYSSVVIEDPKTKVLRELVPFKEAQQLLKKKGIDLPSYANHKRPPPQQRAAAQSPVDQEKEREKREKEQAKQEAEVEVRLRVLKAAFPKVSAKLDKETLIDMAADRADRDMVEHLFGHSDWKKLKEEDLIRLIKTSSLWWSVQNSYNTNESKELYALATKLKVNVDAIRKQVAGEGKKK